MKKANAFVSNAFILCAGTVEKDSCFFVKLRRISLRAVSQPLISIFGLGIVCGAVSVNSCTLARLPLRIASVMPSRPNVLVDESLAPRGSAQTSGGDSAGKPQGPVTGCRLNPASGLVVLLGLTAAA